MGMYLDQTDMGDSGPYFNARSFLLLFCLLIPGCLAWLRGPLPPTEREKLLLVCPWLSLACWILFQAAHISLVPSWGHSGQPADHLAWRTNNWICLGAGVIFSAAVLRLNGIGRQLNGLILLVLNLSLIFSNKFQFWLTYQAMNLFPHGH